MWALCSFFSSKYIKRGCEQLSKIGSLTQQKGTVGNLTPWKEREKIHFLKRLESSSIAVSSVPLGSVNMEASQLHKPWTHYCSTARHNDWCWHQNAESHQGNINYASPRKYANFNDNNKNTNNKNNKANIYQVLTTCQICDENSLIVRLYLLLDSSSSLPNHPWSLDLHLQTWSCPRAKGSSKM